jgi:hypothetical protein
MKDTIIRQGYRLTVLSWENDGDHYATKTLDGLTKEEVACYVELCQLFANEFGNMYEPSADELQVADDAVRDVVQKHRGALSTKDTEDLLRYPAGYMVRFLSSSEHYTFRVCESCKVEYVPADIVLKDVTDEFWKI